MFRTGTKVVPLGAIPLLLFHTDRKRPEFDPPAVPAAPKTPREPSP